MSVIGEALARGDLGARGAALTAAQWVLTHAPATRAGGAGQVASLAGEFAKAVNAPVRAAVVDGRIPVRSAAVVIGEADRLRPLLAPGAEPHVLEGLICMAAQHGPRGARMLRPRLLAQYGHEGQLQAEQDAARQFICLSQPRDGGSPGIFEYALTLDTEGKAVLEAALGPLSAPKPAEGERDLRCQRPPPRRRPGRAGPPRRGLRGVGADHRQGAAVRHRRLRHAHRRLAAQARTARPGDDTTGRP